MAEVVADPTLKPRPSGTSATRNECVHRWTCSTPTPSRTRQHERWSVSLTAICNRMVELVEVGLAERVNKIGKEYIYEATKAQQVRRKRAA